MKGIIAGIIIIIIALLPILVKFRLRSGSSSFRKGGRYFLSIFSDVARIRWNSSLSTAFLFIDRPTELVC